MKLNSLFKARLLASALAFSAVHSANATVTPAYHDGDWLLGFYSGGTKDFVLDLNDALNQSTINIHQSFTLLNSTSHLGDDLSLAACFGANWYGANSGVVYGVVQSFNNNNPVTMYVTNPDLAQGPWPSEAGYGQASSDASSIGINSANATQVSGQQSKGLIQATSAGSSWESFAGPPPNADGYFDGQFQNADDAGDGGISDIVTNKLQFDFITSANGATTKILGTFSLDSAGDLTYTAAAIPEPTTFATVGLGAFLLTFLRRRHA